MSVRFGRVHLCAAVRVYLIHPFRCKVSYRLHGLKGQARFNKNLPFSAAHKTSIVSRKPCKLSVGTLVKHRKGYIKR